MARRAFIAALVVLVVVSRLLHKDLVWIEEAYGLAAAAELLRGKELYSAIWFDKPPVYAWYYALFGAVSGVPLRLAGAAVVLVACWAVWSFGRDLWGDREGLAAAGLLGVGLVFYIPSAVMAVAPDLLMIGPHVLSVWLAWRRRPLLAGLTAGFATLCNSKGVLVALACVVFAGPGAGWVLAGWAVVTAASFAWLPAGEYWRQVWVWGWAYSADPSPGGFGEGVRRTLNWAGFHAATVIGAAVCLWRDKNWRLIAWVLVALAGVAGGLRFFPRYYFMLLPVVSLLGGRGLLLLSPRVRLAAILLILVPVARFAPTYWNSSRDTALMEDSRSVGFWLRGHAGAGADLLVWGYRPDVYVFSGLPAATRYLDSQPLTGVLADRHLVNSRSTFPELAARHRRELAGSAPQFVVDGLGTINPSLAIASYAELTEWWQRYELVFQTPTAVVYRRKPSK